jgi:hypothetical protein
VLDKNTAPAQRLKLLKTGIKMQLERNASILDGLPSGQQDKWRCPHFRGILIEPGIPLYTFSGSHL